MAFGKTVSIESGDPYDSVVWDAVLLGNGSAVAVVWGDYNISQFYLTMVPQGASPGAAKALTFTVDSLSRPHAAAVGSNEFAVVWDGGSSTSPSMTLFDSSGNVIKAITYASGTSHYSITGLGDASGTFIVKWADATGHEFYTRYGSDGNAVSAGQTAKQMTPTEASQAPSSFVGDGTGGFLYSSVANQSDLTKGSNLYYVSSTGVETLKLNVPGGHRGALAFDGLDYYYFYSNAAYSTPTNQIFMVKIDHSTWTASTAVAISGFTSTLIPTVTALANRQFLLEDQDQREFLIVSNTGSVVSSYSVPTNVYGLIAPTTDSGGLWVENYAGTDGTHYDLKAEDWNSGYMEIPATVTTPGALAFPDTTASDTFSASAAATISATSATTIAAYGIQGGTTGGSHVISSVTYDVSKAGSYGTLYVQSSTGKYSYEPNSTAINALSANASDSFTLTVDNAAVANGTATLTVNLTGVNDLPLLANLNGNTQQFTAGASNPITDNAKIGPSTVALTDADSANLGSGYLQINQSSGGTDGYFYSDVTRVKSGTTDVGADARFTAGENVYVDTSGTGSTFVAIGTVAASGGVLRIDFNTLATPTTVTTLLKYLAYGAPTTGSRSFTLQVNDGDGGTSAASSFTMTGVDLTPPSISSASPADNATNVALATSPQITFSEAIKFGTGKIYLVDVSAGSVVEQFDVTTAQGTADGQVSISGTTLTINPTASLSSSKTYAIKIDATAITDLPGNAFAGISDTNTLNFATIADPPPTLASIVRSTPAGSPTNADSLTFLVTFSEAVSNVDAADFATTGTTATVTSVTSAGGNAYSVTVSGGDLASLNGTVGLSVSGSNNIVDSATNALSGTTPTGLNQTYTLDSTVSAPAFALAADTGTSASDGVTRNGTVNVTLAGDVASWEYSVDAGAHWTSGTGTSFTLAEGNYASGAIQVRQTDTAGNLSTAASSASAISVDATANAPAFALATDSGASANDNISNDGTVSVTLPADKASWEYSLDGGSHWSTGSGTSFALSAGAYAVGAVQVRYTDSAGNPSAAASNAAAITIDTTANASSLALAADTGASSSDGITTNATVNVTLSADTASWEYSVNGGSSWSAGSGTSFDLAEGLYAAGDIKLRYTDTAGNSSTVAANAGAINVDKTVAAPTLALASDTGTGGDGITSSGGVTVTLASDAASWQYSTDNGASWITGSGSSFTLAAGTYASGTVQVKQTDTAGNVSAAGSIAGAVTVDQSAAAPSFAFAHDTGASSTDGITSDGTVDVTLPADAASWEYRTDGVHWNAGTGTSFVLAEGSYAGGSVEVRYTDLAANVSAVYSNAATIKVDNSVAAPAVALHADTGASDGITNNPTIDVTLAADAASWEYRTDGVHWTAGSGTSFTLADGSYGANTIEVRQTDTAGNTSAVASIAAAVTIDTVAAAPSVALATDTGTSGDRITSDGTVNVTLPADAASWEYSTDGTHWITGTDSSFVLAEGTYATGTVKVRYTDVAGTLSADGANAGAITVDTTAAAGSLGLAADTGASTTDGVTKNSAINVTLPADAASWQYSVDGGAHWTTGAGASFDLAEGVYASGDIKLRYTDVAGNASAVADNAGAITIDKTAAAPSLALASDTGASNSDGISGSGAVNVTLASDVDNWEYSTDAGASWNSGSGTSFTLVAGTYPAGALQVRQTDVAGNLSAAASNAAPVIIDHAAVPPSFALAQDTGTSSSDGITNNGTVNVTLPADVSSWRYSVDNGAHWSGGTGASFTLAQGSYAGGSIRVDYTDLAGNLSTAANNAAAITVDATVAAPALALHADTGASGSDGITRDTSVDVTLAGDAAGWEYSTDGGAHWTTGSGTSFTLVDGSYAAGDIRVRQTDIAGNLSAAASNASAVTIDTAAAAPALALAADTGASGSDGITSIGTVDVTLPGDAASWEYSTDNGAHWTAGSGSAFALAEGIYASSTVKVRYTDTAGNLSPASGNATAITVDATVAAPALALPADSGASSSDGITKNTTVNVTLATDVASWRYSVDGGAHWTAGSGISFTLGDGTYASGSVQVRQTDTAGNLSTAAANAAALTIDTIAAAPAFALVADTGASSSDGISNNGAVSVTLPGDAASWEFSTDGGSHWTAGSGTGFALVAGSYASGAVQVRYTDTAGNASPAAANAGAITIDTSAPAGAMSLAADTGSSASDSITSNATVNVTLPADAVSWQYSVNAGTDWSAGSGSSFDLPEGVYASGDIKLRYTDLAGNAAVASNAAAITVDQTIAPPSLALASDTGTSATDGITSNGDMSVTLASDAASWQYSVDGGAHWTNGSGTSFTLAAGTYATGSVLVRQTDIAGNQSAAAANAAPVTVDQSAPAPSFAIARDTGASGSDGVTNDGTVNVTLPGDTASWKYSADGGSHWATGSGTSFVLAQGSYAANSVQVRYTDLAANLSAASSNAAAITVDSSVAAPAFALHADTGTSNSDGITNDTVVTVTLASDAAGWEYSIDSGAHWTTGSGTSFTLPDGGYALGTIQVRQTDVAGNLSAATANASALTIDTAAAAPSFGLATDTGASGSDGVTSDGTVNVVLAPDAASWEYSVDGGGHWSTGSGTSFALAEGSYATGAVKLRYTDSAGNTSTAAANPAAINVDRTVAAPSLALAADTGSSSSDGLTNNTSVQVTLAADVASWEFSVDGGARWTAGSGSSFTLDDGSYAAGAVQVRQADIAGNVSAASASTSAIIIDTSAPAPALALAGDTGASASDGITANGIVNATLPADAASWEFSVDGGAHWSAGTGTSFTLAEGAYTSHAVQLRYTDKAGNLSAAATNAAAITVDHTAAAPTIALAADTGSSASDGVTNNTQVNVTPAPDMASWEYSTDAGVHWNAGAGTSFTLADGSYAAGALQARQTDLAGNLSAAGSNAAPVKVDTVAAAPSFAIAVDTGSSATDGITSNAAVNVTLPADSASWEYSVDGGAHWSTGSGTSFNLGEGSYAGGAVQVRYTDVAGNLSAAGSNPAAITMDASAPAASLALANDTGDNRIDGITLDPQIRVTLPADVASWEYSLDSGARWETGHGSSLVLNPGLHVAGSIQVRYTDLAGNHSATASSGADYTILRPPVVPPVSHDVDGVAVTVGTVTNSDGTTSQVITVPVVLPTRVDDTGAATVADIPLVSGSNGAPPALAALVPAGFGLEVSGATTPLVAATGLNELLREIQAHSSSGATDQGALAAAGTGFLSNLSAGAPLVVQSVTPAIGAGTTPGAPLVIAAPAAAPGGAVTALVIDASGLPSGTNIELQNVDFAALIGPMRATGGEGRQTVFGDGASQYIVLGPDDDVLHGGAGDDIVGSEGGNDRIFGDDGNDLVFGGEGDDLIDGGSGTDTVLLQGASRADYSFRFDHGNLVATQLHGGPDGTDIIANVELLRFAGGSADMGAQGTLRRIYDTLFDRPADAAGTAFWTGMNAKGMPMHDITASLLGAPEASGLARLSNAAFVDQLYLDALGVQPLRPASADERAQWVALLDQGKADRASVLVGIANSAQKLALDAQEQSQVAFADTDAATVVRLYDTVFGRLGDEAGVNYWIGASEHGVAMKDIVNAFLRSAEGTQHYGNTADDQFVDALYNVGLGRHADATEISWWSDKLHTGVLSRADMVLYFADSPEKVALIGHSTTIPGM